MGVGHAASQIEIDNRAPSENSLDELGPTLAPLQYVRFCQRHRVDCNPSAEVSGPIRTSKNFELIDRLNRRVNDAIVPVRKSYGEKLNPRWTIAPKSGDCNDDAVTK
jgi:predicted transglutaminase-like cysteine proteinase